MSGADVFEVIQTFRARRRPFCLATVVRTADLTSAKAGAKAVVTEGGEIIGHLGGGCVQGAVRRASAEVLASATPRMISVQPANAARSNAEGVEIHTSGCPSGGTVDVFIEPHLQPLRLSVLGESPIAQALRQHGALMGYAVADTIGGIDAIGAAGTGVGADAGTRADPGAGTRADPGADAVIIASQGAGDLSALRQALHSGAPFVAMVASHRKAQHLTAKLRDEGMDPTMLDRLISPAGLDLGAIDAHEIAVSILAQLIVTRRAARDPD
ncbi:MAG: XdhC family protein [Pseudomonadota bacterium]